MRRVALLLFLPACGYTWGAAATQQRTEAGELPRIAVRPFDNLTFRRGLEIRLTRLVADEVRARSPGAPYSFEAAEWIVTGRIVAAEERVLSEDREDKVRESSFFATVEVSVEDRAARKTRKTYTLTRREPFSSRAGRIATLEQAEEQVLRDLAESIVYGLEEEKPKRTP